MNGKFEGCRIPDKCLTFQLVKDVNCKKLEGKKISFNNLSDKERYNLRIDRGNKSEYSWGLTKLRVALESTVDPNFDGLYISLVSSKKTKPIEVKYNGA